ncbi:MAG: histidinol-phosphate transaminase [Oscillospiraceae bacterium]|nr:histidinol-phosphate transaminase [Oscillospiraceae bacterium]
MSRFISPSTAALKPYTPGEQPRVTQYIKLNTNESPYPPSPRVREAIDALAYEDLRLYPDPDVTGLRDAIAAARGISQERVFVGGGSDEILGYAFMAFFERGDTVVFPDVTYGFYPVHAQVCGLEVRTLPLRGDFSLEPSDYYGAPGHIVLANPNAPTGIALPPARLEDILRANPDRLIIVDEAYTDFSPQNTARPLLDLYDNLLITRTFSKAYGLAGMRIGCALGEPGLISALNCVKYAFNPYNLDRVSIAVGTAAVSDTDYLQRTVDMILATRDWFVPELEAMGFSVLPSAANFVFVRHATLKGAYIYDKLRENGILVRIFAYPERISDHLRVSIGTDGDMRRVTDILKSIVK